MIKLILGIYVFGFRVKPMAVHRIDKKKTSTPIFPFRLVIANVKDICRPLYGAI